MERLGLIALGGALGAVLRYGCTLAGARWAALGIPLAVLLVNVLGSFVAGWLMETLVQHSANAAGTASGDFWGAGENWRAFAMVGVLGAFTTFSAFSIENLELLREGQVARAALHGLLHVGLSIGAAALGAVLAR